MENNKGIITSLLVVALVVGLVAAGQWGSKKEGLVETPEGQIETMPSVLGPPPERGVVESVVDGITIRLTSGHVVRYIGVDVPEVKTEVQCFGKEAVLANESIIGADVRLEEEPLLLRSRDGAWTRYVFFTPEEAEEVPSEVLSVSPGASVTPDGPEEIFVNERILEGGFGWPIVAENMVYGERLLSAARYGSATGKGLWGRCKPETNEATGEWWTEKIGECVIKGQVTLGGEKYYRTPECKAWKDTIVIAAKGDGWFCSEEEAQGAGFLRGPDC